MPLVIKSADESKSSDATLADDDELVIATVAGARYMVESVVICSADSAPDLQFRFEHSGDTESFVGQLTFHNAVTAVSTFDLSDVSQRNALAEWIDSGGSVYTIGGSATGSNRGVVHLAGLLKVGASGGNLALRWAQATSGAAASIVRAGSWLRLVAV